MAKQSNVTYLHGQLRSALSEFDVDPTPIGAVNVVRHALTAGVKRDYLDGFSSTVMRLVKEDDGNSTYAELESLTKLLADLRLMETECDSGQRANSASETQNAVVPGRQPDPQVQVVLDSLAADQALITETLAEAPNSGWYPGMSELQPFWDRENPSIVDEVREQIERMLPLAAPYEPALPLGESEIRVRTSLFKQYEVLLKSLINLCSNVEELRLITLMCPWGLDGGEGQVVYKKLCSESDAWMMLLQARTPCLRLAVRWLDDHEGWIVSKEAALFVVTRFKIYELNNRPLMSLEPSDDRGNGYGAVIQQQTLRLGSVIRAAFDKAGIQEEETDASTDFGLMLSRGGIHFVELLGLIGHADDLPELLNESNDTFDHAERSSCVDVLCDGILESADQLFFDQYMAPRQLVDAKTGFLDFHANVQSVWDQWFLKRLRDRIWAAPFGLPCENYASNPYALFLTDDYYIEDAHLRDNSIRRIVQGFIQCGWPKLAGALAAHHLLQYTLQSKSPEDKGEWHSIFRLLDAESEMGLASQAIQLSIGLGTLSSTDACFLGQYVEQGADGQSAEVLPIPHEVTLRRPVAKQNLRRLMIDDDGKVLPLQQKAWDTLVDTEVRFMQAHADYASGEQGDFWALIVGMAKAIEIHIRSTLGNRLKPCQAEVLQWLVKCDQETGKDRLSLGNFIYLMKFAPRLNAFPAAVRSMLEQATSNLEDLKRLGEACEVAKLLAIRNPKAHSSSASLSEAQQFREMLARKNGVLYLLPRALPVKRARN